MNPRQTIKIKIRKGCVDAMRVPDRYRQGIDSRRLNETNRYARVRQCRSVPSFHGRIVHFAESAQFSFDRYPPRVSLRHHSLHSFGVFLEGSEGVVMRLTNSTLRNGASFTYGNFDPRKMPQSITLPGGGTETLSYDLLKRLLQRKITYLSTTWEEDFTYDAEDRERVETYIQNGGNNNTTTYDYDAAGPLLAAHYHEDGADFGVTNTYYADASRNMVTYPSGVTVTETRDNATRLTGVSDANGNIISASAWSGTFLPQVVKLGSNIQIVKHSRRAPIAGLPAAASPD